VFGCDRNHREILRRPAWASSRLNSGLSHKADLAIARSKLDRTLGLQKAHHKPKSLRLTFSGEIFRKCSGMTHAPAFVSKYQRGTRGSQLGSWPSPPQLVALSGHFPFFSRCSFIIRRPRPFLFDQSQSEAAQQPKKERAVRFFGEIAARCTFDTVRLFFQKSPRLDSTIFFHASRIVELLVVYVLYKSSRAAFSAPVENKAAH